MDLLKLMSDYAILKNLVLESSTLKPWWWRRRGLAQIVRETVLKYQSEYEEILGQVFFTRLTFQDFYLYHYVVREEFDVSTPGHQVACVSFVVYVMQRWAALEGKFSRDYILDSLCFPLWQRVLEEVRWQSRRPPKRVYRRRGRNTQTPLNSAEQLPPRPSIPFPFLGGRATEPLLPSFRLSREPPSPGTLPSPLPALVLNQRTAQQQQQEQQALGEQESLTVMIPISRTDLPGTPSRPLDGATSMCSSSQSDQQQPPPLPPKLRQRRYLEKVVEETEEQLQQLTLTMTSSSSSSLSSNGSSGQGEGSQSRLCPGESSPRARATPAKCRRALQL